MGEVKNVDGAAKDVEKMKALGVDAAFLLNFMRGLLILESARKENDRINAAIKAKRKIQLQYRREDTGALK